MNLHEYQAKNILVRYGIPTPEFIVLSRKEEARAAIEKLGLQEGVVKIQVHAGGRGKAGGVRFGKTAQELELLVGELLGMKMVNQQTGSAGVIAKEVMLCRSLKIKKEYYLGAVIDRNRARAVLIASREGGMEIEEIAKKDPDKILQIPIGLDGKVRSYHKLYLSKFMGWEGEVATAGGKIASQVAQAFVDTDASLIEINPLVEDEMGKLWALDGKMSVDDNALYRQKEIAAMFDPTQVSQNEVLAKAHDLAYIALEGNIGCMVNGAGLAMATMDIIDRYGGKPANFLDVGGSASKEKVAAGFQIILSDPQVRAILVNIFGGIMDCATLAEGIIAASKEIGIEVPLVVRMEGTNVEEGKRLLKESKLPIITADGLATAAEKVVATLG